MRLARAMKRKMEKQVAIRKKAVAEITTTMVVAVHRVFGWGADRILRLRKKMRS